VTTFAGGLRVARYSWPLYAGAGVAIAIGAALAFSARVPLLVRWAALAGMAVAPGGRLVLIEHPRNLAGILAFGPGVLHFLPMAEWSRLAALTGFRMESERAMSPFVRVRVYQAA